MSSERQHEANRRNALQSTGPKTEQGIEAARFNALRHGLRSLQTVVPGEDPEAWETHRAGIVDDLKPVGAVELALAEQIAVKLWRLGRVVRHEVDLIAISQDPDLAFILGVWDRLTDECKRRLLEIIKANLPAQSIENRLSESILKWTKMDTGDRLLSVQAPRLVAKITALKCRF